MKILIQNKTHWRTADLRRFIREGMKRERRNLCKRGAVPLQVVVKYNRGGDRHGNCSGNAYLNSNWIPIHLQLPRAGSFHDSSRGGTRFSLLTRMVIGCFVNTIMQNVGWNLKNSSQPAGAGAPVLARPRSGQSTAHHPRTGAGRDPG